MNKSKLITFFKFLDKKEQTLFKKFVSSPFFNRHQDVIKLTEFILSRKNWNEKSLHREKVFAYLFPNTAYDDLKIRHVMSYLLKMIEQFFIQIEMTQEENYEDLYLIRALQRRQITAYLPAAFREADKKQEQAKYRNAFYHYINYQIHQERYDYTATLNRTTSLNLQEMSDELTMFFISNKLKQACTSLSHQAVYQTDYNEDLLDEVLLHVAQKKYEKVPAIALYYHAYNALTDTEQNQHHFQQLKIALMNYGERFSKEELGGIYRLALNYCIRQLNSGNRTYMQEILDLYKSGLSQNVFLINGILSRWTYKNIVAIGLALEEYRWIERFIYDYKSFLNIKYRASSFSYNLAKLYYTKKQFDKAMPLLLQVEHDDLLLSLSAKMTLVKIYYELEEFDALEALLNSFKVFIQRKKVIGYHRTNYLNMIRSARKLVHLNFYDREAVSKFEATIKDTKILTEKKWFLEMLEKK